jgi:hypothetical protein
MDWFTIALLVLVLALGIALTVVRTMAARREFDLETKLDAVQAGRNSAHAMLDAAYAKVRSLEADLDAERDRCRMLETGIRNATAAAKKEREARDAAQLLAAKRAEENANLRRQIRHEAATTAHGV